MRGQRYLIQRGEKQENLFCVECLKDNIVTSRDEERVHEYKSTGTKRERWTNTERGRRAKCQEGTEDLVARPGGWRGVMNSFRGQEG